MGHRYYVCSNFHNKGSSACKANSIRAYEAEESVINRLKDFLADSKLYINTIESLNKKTVQSTIHNQHELEKFVQQLIKVNTMQEKYMEAFEQNLFPTAILQERLQKLSIEKKGLEQKKNELSIQLSSSDSKVIPPDVIRHLLEKFLGIFKQSSREKKKQLFQLLLNNITIKHSNGRSRTVDKIELDFDFSEVNLSKTFTLIHILYLDSEESSTSNPDLNDKMPPYLQLFLPLFMIRFPPINPKRPINLLHQNQPHQLMGKCHLTKRQLIIRSIQHLVTKPQRSTNNKSNLTLPICT